MLEEHGVIPSIDSQYIEYIEYRLSLYLTSILGNLPQRLLLDTQESKRLDFHRCRAHSSIKSVEQLWKSQRRAQVHEAELSV